MKKNISNGLVDLETIEKMRNSININNNIWINYETTNCYAYALNMDLSYKELKPYEEFGVDIYNVGMISNLKTPKTKEELVNAFKSDMKIIKIEVTDVLFDEILKENEWKVALYQTVKGIDYIDNELDFHFAKETENGIWSHKKGKTKKTSYLDDNNEIIKNPLLAYFAIDEENGNSVKYDFIGCYKLKKK